MMEKEKLLDKDIREPLFDFLEETYGKVRILEEKTTGRARADVVMITEDMLYGIEIKSDADTYARLKKQVRNYDMYYDRNIVVVGSSHGSHISEHVPKHWGIITVEAEKDGTVDFYILREPKDNPKVKDDRKISILWRIELNNLLKINGLPRYPQKSKFFVQQALLERVDHDVLWKQACNELFERDYNTIGETIEEYRISKIKNVIGMLMFACVLLAGCNVNVNINDDAKQSGESAVSKEYINEGVDTKCEITGYESYKGGPEGYFLSKGDKIAVISPSALPSRTQVDTTLEGLKKCGFIPVEGKYVCPKTRTLDELIEDLEWALSDPSIRAIFCVRGGYGSSEVLDTIPIDMIKEAEKPIIGYSDITTYHSAWTTEGLPSIHACMSGTFGDFPKDCFDAQIHMMKGEIPSYKCETETQMIKGTAEGILIGGNLSTFTATLNTGYDSTKIDEPYVLFLEDVGEDIQHIHRYLTLLKHMGVLDRAQGIIFGEWIELPADGSGNFGAARGGEFKSVADMIQREFLADMDIPVAFGFPAGHGDDNYPLLMGGKVYLNVSDGSYTITWNN